MEPDPNIVVPAVVDATTNALKSAFKEPSVKRFVLTSSSTAAYSPDEGNDKPLKVTVDTWNDSVVEAAWAPPPYTADRGFVTYSASKTQGEQALWKYYKEHAAEKPGFVVNSVLPNMNTGLILNLEHQSTRSTVGFLKPVWDGEPAKHTGMIPPQFYVDVQDCARLHVAALLLPDVREERVFAFATPFNVNTELAAFRKIRPGRKFVDDLPDVPVHLAEVPNDRAEELLRKVGRKGWVPMEESFENMLPAYEQ
ncbi:MAG: hypothetical protein INR71_09990 [Terriglobus roseus]|nr:hypothetical protein [Terriglobus roseus]